MDQEEFSRRYDELYAKASAVLEKHNPCKIENDTCIRGREDGIHSFCCYGCTHLSDDGCTVQCLWCRTWTCAAIPGEVRAELREIEHEAGNHGMIMYRCSKEELMERNYGTQRTMQVGGF